MTTGRINLVSSVERARRGLFGRGCDSSLQKLSSRPIGPTRRLPSFEERTQRSASNFLRVWCFVLKLLLRTNERWLLTGLALFRRRVQLIAHGLCRRRRFRTRALSVASLQEFLGGEGRGSRPGCKLLFTKLYSRGSRLAACARLRCRVVGPARPSALF